MINVTDKRREKPCCTKIKCSSCDKVIHFEYEAEYVKSIHGSQPTVGFSDLDEPKQTKLTFTKIEKYLPIIIEKLVAVDTSDNDDNNSVQLQPIVVKEPISIASQALNAEAVNETASLVASHEESVNIATKPAW